MDPILSLLDRATQEGSWTLLAAALLYGCVELAKRLPWLRETDARRRVLALVLAYAPGLALVLSGHSTFTEATTSALVTWGLATATHFMVHRKGVTDPTIPLLVLVALGSAGCGGAGAQEEIRRALEASRDIAAAAEPCLAATKEAELAACAEPTCEAEIRERYAALADAFDAFRAAWCALVPASCEAQP